MGGLGVHGKSIECVIVSSLLRLILPKSRI